MSAEIAGQLVPAVGCFRIALGRSGNDTKAFHVHSDTYVECATGTLATMFAMAIGRRADRALNDEANRSAQATTCQHARWGHSQLPSDVRFARLLPNRILSLVSVLLTATRSIMRSMCPRPRLVRDLE